MYYNPEIVPLPNPLTYDFIHANITSYTGTIRDCFDNHYKRSPDDQIPLDDIVEDCVGKKGIFLVQYYNDVRFMIKQYLKQSLDSIFLEGICDQSLLECIEYLKAVYLFSEMELDISRSVQGNQNILIKKIGLDKLNFFRAVSLDTITDYFKLKQILKQEQTFLLKITKLKRDQYRDEYLLKKEGEDDGDAIGDMELESG